MRNLIILFLILILFACGSPKKAKQTSLEYLYTHEAFRIVDEIRIAYQKRDNEGIRKNVTDSLYREIIASIKPFDKVEIEFTPVLVEIEGDTIRLFVSWNGRWSYLGKETEEKALASFLLRGKPLKVEKIIRGNPFRYPE